MRPEGSDSVRSPLTKSAEMALSSAHGCPVRIATRIVRARSCQNVIVLGCACRQARTSAKISASVRVVSPEMRRQAPTLPPNPQARSPDLPFCRSSAVIFSEVCPSILPATMR